jgi:hypothetical protein
MTRKTVQPEDGILVVHILIKTFEARTVLENISLAILETIVH